MSAGHSISALATVTIYALCDPDTLEPRYVGKAISLAARIRGHRWEAKSNKLHSHKINWLRSLNGRDPEVIVLAEVGFDRWQEAERHWIAEMKRRGCNLTNFADGGQTSPVEGKGHTEEAKAKMRAAAIKNGAKPPSQKGRKASEETRRKLRAAVLFRGATPPAMGGWNKGVRRTHCKNGHEYTKENTRLYRRPDRDQLFQICRTCERQNRARFSKKK